MGELEPGCAELWMPMTMAPDMRRNVGPGGSRGCRV